MMIKPKKKIRCIAPKQEITIFQGIKTEGGKLGVHLAFLAGLSFTGIGEKT